MLPSELPLRSIRSSAVSALICLACAAALPCVHKKFCYRTLRLKWLGCLEIPLQVAMTLPPAACICICM